MGERRRVSLQVATSFVRWPFGRIEVDDRGFTVRWGAGDERKVRWDEVDGMVRCGFFARHDVRVHLSDGRRLVVGGPGLPALLDRFSPGGSMPTEKRRLFPLWHGTTHPGTRAGGQ
jgi:hypothetical protein